ncbi:E3 ubiquitin-protein ligase CHFR-like [Pyrus ussuriensis x Pyrus communis]|uniref:E3 ubiquitin-protein ligase CHFR-like n=1 Tax=Pyrus ussuriensis x Pyrus communis TaxID=2448454 RepID=A0A5N5FVB1_9ROSA|nr:E3 ubiquitin-protein ligase CHFR-like [Pyrus ussuriensis x Pyrus communis]
MDVERAKCCICLNIWHDVLTIAPCFHNFCNGCFSEWLKRSQEKRSSVLVQCRAVLQFVGRNHFLLNVAGEILKANSSLKRSNDDVATFDSYATRVLHILKLLRDDTSFWVICEYIQGMAKVGENSCAKPCEEFWAKLVPSTRDIRIDLVLFYSQMQVVQHNKEFRPLFCHNQNKSSNGIVVDGTVIQAEDTVVIRCGSEIISSGPDKEGYLSYRLNVLPAAKCCICLNIWMYSLLKEIASCLMLRRKY